MKAKAKFGVVYHENRHNDNLEYSNFDILYLYSKKGVQVSDRDDEKELSKRQ